MPFTTNDKLVFSLRGREGKGYYVCFSSLTTKCSLFEIDSCAERAKDTKISELGVAFSNEGVGNVDEVVLKEWMFKNAIRLRF